ncbi:hypothetical protein [Pedobacter miscanthi]|uniref:hypothetical protein n=1 Tax=Pedobacter miscanthi TaxID=2259170 RepID=UPI002930C604|nr:hypothetical protein [Pedobacter miscanthi]
MEIKRVTFTALFFFCAIVSANGQAINITNDQYHLYGPNSTWSQYLQVGGNGQVTDHAFVAVTNGNLHLDAKAGFATYINYYNKGNTYLNPQEGNVGIGTTFPATKFEVMQPTSGWTMNSRVNAPTAGEINGLKFYSGYIGEDKWAGISSISESLHSNKTGLALYSGMTERVRISGDGNIGIGTNIPSSLLHLSGTSASIDGGNGYQFGGTGLIIQANTGGRTFDKGAQIEFAIPAGADGNNAWGQARIITVAGNNNNNDATGKMILGTRRMFSKNGDGQQWFYGDDIVIDGSGNIGINTLNPTEKLMVNGKIKANEIRVNGAGAPDYVFEDGYKVATLKALEGYIKRNRHLPEVPSAKEFERDGIALGDMNKLLLKKIEELTLHLIEKDKQYDGLLGDVKKQEARIRLLETKLEKQ